MFKELFLATIISTSVSVRTPNDTTKPLDYEYSLKAESKEGKINYLIKRDWERELGVKYIDDIVNFNHKVGYLYYGIDYVDKESKDIDYKTYNFGAYWPDEGFRAGIAFKDSIPLLNLGFNKKAKILNSDGSDNIEYNIDISAKSDIGLNNIVNFKSEVKKWLTPRVNVFGLYKHEYYNEQEDFQFKVGVGVKLWLN